MAKMKGGANFSYTNLKTQIKMMLSTPHSNKYKNDFSQEIFRQSKTISDICDEIGFNFGTIYENENVWKDFKKAVPAHFNSITTENAMKWGHLSPSGKIGEYDFTHADKAVNYAAEHGVRVRGHALIWGRVPGKSYPIEVEEIIKNSSTPKEDLKIILNEHVKTVVNHFKGKVATWDVVNEPMSVFGEDFADYSFYNVLETDYITNAFYAAHEADDTLSLTLNEQFFYYRDKRAINFLKFVKNMKESGVPIDTVGLQHHVMFVEQNLDDMKWFIGELDKMGIYFEITELDIRQKIFKKSKNPQLAQAESYYKIAKTCLEAGNCKGITVWGIHDGRTWYDNVPPFNMKMFKPSAPLLFDENFNKKPAYLGVLTALSEVKR